MTDEQPATAPEVLVPSGYVCLLLLVGDHGISCAAPSVTED